MKKIAFVMSVAGLSLLVACGPSAEEKALKDKAAADSAKAADEKLKHEQDSIANIARLDSIKRADSLAAIAAKPAEPAKGGTKKPTITKEQQQTNTSVKNVSGVKGGTTTVKTPEQQKVEDKSVKTIRNIKGGN